MTLDELSADVKEAMKARDAVRLQVLRHVLAQLKNLQIEKKGELSEDDIVQVLKKGVKSRMESVEMYTKGGRDDLVAQEKAEIAVLEAYLPEKLSGEELKAAVAAIIAELDATSMKDMGAVMKGVMAAHGSVVDGKDVQQVVKELLAG